MTSHQLALDAEGTAHAAHLVFEQSSQRLHNLEVHLLRQTAHIVVRLDFAARSVDAHTLDDIRINGALCKPFRSFNLLGLSLENINKG